MAIRSLGYKVECATTDDVQAARYDGDYVSLRQGKDHIVLPLNALDDLIDALQRVKADASA